jgi:hypothetical protein
MKTLQLLAFVALMSATAMPSIAQEQGRSHPPSTSSVSYGPGFSGPGLTGPGSSGPRKRSRFMLRKANCVGIGRGTKEICGVGDIVGADELRL